MSLFTHSSWIVISGIVVAGAITGGWIVALGGTVAMAEVKRSVSTRQIGLA